MVLVWKIRESLYSTCIWTEVGKKKNVRMWFIYLSSDWLKFILLPGVNRAASVMFTSMTPSVSSTLAIFAFLMVSFKNYVCRVIVKDWNIGWKSCAYALICVIKKIWLTKSNRPSNCTTTRNRIDCATKHIQIKLASLFQKCKSADICVKMWWVKVKSCEKNK